MTGLGCESVGYEGDVRQEDVTGLGCVSVGYEGIQDRRIVY